MPTTDQPGVPDPSTVTEADQYAYLGMNEERLPELETCRCDAAPYLHLTAVIPATEGQDEYTPVRACLVVQAANHAIAVLRITGGGAK